MKRRMETALCIICAVILMWFVISWIDVALHNGNENPVYADWNLLTWIFTKGGN